MGALETWSPKYLVETKVALHAQGQEKPPIPKPLHPPLKLDAGGEPPQDKWAVRYIVPHTTTRKKDAAKITVTRHLPHTTQVYELTAPNVLVTHRQHDERYTIKSEGTATTTLYTWATRGDLPHLALHHTPCWPTPFHKQTAPTRNPSTPREYTPTPKKPNTDTMHDERPAPSTRTSLSHASVPPPPPQECRTPPTTVP